MESCYKEKIGKIDRELMRGGWWMSFECDETGWHGVYEARVSKHEGVDKLKFTVDEENLTISAEYLDEFGKWHDITNYNTMMDILRLDNDEIFEVATYKRSGDYMRALESIMLNLGTYADREQFVKELIANDLLENIGDNE